MKRLYWAGISKEERHVAIDHIQHCINQYGFIADFQLFSDISIGLVIEIEAIKIQALYEALCAILQMDDMLFELTEFKAQYLIMLNITFAHSSGNMRIEVPAVPG